MAQDPQGIILITGTLASGKTSVAIEMGRQLEGRGIRCAVVDLDWLGWVHALPGFAGYDVLMVRNLGACWPNFRVAGATHFVLARTLRSTDALAALARMFPLTPVAVVRLTASPATLRARLERRDDPETLREHLADLDAMTAAVDKLPIEPFVVANDGRPLGEVAREVIERTGW
jgi:hypothetical protein